MVPREFPDVLAVSLRIRTVVLKMSSSIVYHTVVPQVMPDAPSNVTNAPHAPLPPQPRRPSSLLPTRSLPPAPRSEDFIATLEAPVIHSRTRTTSRTTLDSAVLNWRANVPTNAHDSTEGIETDCAEPSEQMQARYKDSFDDLYANEEPVGSSGETAGSTWLSFPNPVLP